MIQARFAMHDPIVALRKFRRFAAMDPDSAAARSFVAPRGLAERWHRALLPVADEALLGWYEANTAGRNAWQVAAKSSTRPP